RLCDARLHLVAPSVAGYLLDDAPEDDVVGVRVVELCSWFTDPSSGLGDGDHLVGRPRPLPVVDNSRFVLVVVEPARVLQQLTRGDRVRTRQVGQVRLDPCIEIDPTFFGELDHDNRDHRLGQAADVPGRVEIDG